MQYRLDEVALHNTEQDCWIVINDKVYDVTRFVSLHPGGVSPLLRAAGTDISDEFNSFHRPEVLVKYKKLCIGSLATPSLARQAQLAREQKGFGDMIPYGDPYWYNHAFKSPYYKATHREFRAKVRAFVETQVKPFVNQWDEAGTYPPDLHKKAYAAGLYGAIWPVKYGGTPPRDFDFFHDLVLVDELARCGAGGVMWACFLSFGISLPPILRYGSEFLKNKVARDVITGNKIMSLAVTEPYGGSDVAGLRATARREGDFYIVNGEKKFITSGTKAAYFTTAVRTGGAGIRGISVLLIERDMPGVSIRRQNTQGWWISGTAYLTFRNVKVPVSHLVGEENKGFKAIMENFNHERFVLAATSNRYSRVCLEDAIRYARQRKTFRRRLIDHQVIRHKIGEMARRIEATHALLEQVAYQFQSGVADKHLSGIVALLKVQSTKSMEFCAREASQILGGASYVRGGVGHRIERLYREVRVNAIGGGSEEILLDLAAKQAKL